jgi:hypothetical protein
MLDDEEYAVLSEAVAESKRTEDRGEAGGLGDS